MPKTAVRSKAVPKLKVAPKKKAVVKKRAKPDVVNKNVGETWAYTDIVKSHFFNPQNLLWEMPDPAVAATFDAEGMVGSPACGDVMRVWLKIDPKSDRVKEFKWRTFGCASAIAATSMLSVIVVENEGMKIDEAMKLRPQDIMKRLGGLPDRKIHCSVLGDKALRAALNDWFKKTGQLDRIVVEGTKIIDPATKVTEADIEEAVLEGAVTLDDVQKRTKVAIGNPDIVPQVEQLIRFYREKYYGPDGK
ncbi:MAG TPA: iron-sulfur cluster assembly scaffold protein [Candidatus Paceibacterota bacterium]|nr:iron-sulfur cluster assembly scaffold protein [Candidatus Paceibacterota bacterium]